jgi:hypothetical protein
MRKLRTSNSEWADLPGRIEQRMNGIQQRLARGAFVWFHSQGCDQAKRSVSPADRKGRVAIVQLLRTSKRRVDVYAVQPWTESSFELGDDGVRAK